MSKIELGEITIDVVRKKIKNLHLSVRPPGGQVRISAPTRMNLEVIRAFAISKLDWIKRQQRNLQAQASESSREYEDEEKHHAWGNSYVLKIIEETHLPKVELQYPYLYLWAGPSSDRKRRETILEDWYRTELQQIIPTLIAKWEPRMGVKVNRFAIQKMKTRWGSCNTITQNIKINLELAKKSPEFLEYIVIHEMTHLLEPSHNHRFTSLMTQFMPEWRAYRKELNRLPTSGAT